MFRSRALEYISNMNHGVIIAVGSGKQGKSCTLHSVLGVTHPMRPVCILDSMDYDIGMFPKNYRLVHNPDHVAPGSICIIEDVNRMFHSRGSSKDATLQKWLGVISHKDILLAITTQSMAATDIEFLRSQDSVVLHKYMHEEDLNYERPEFRDHQAVADDWIMSARVLRPDLHPNSWTFFPRFAECVSVQAAPWWGYEHSHMLREVNVCR